MNFKKTLYFFLQTIIIFALIIALLIYISLLSPSNLFYDNSGIQYLSIVILISPAILIIGLLTLLLNIKLRLPKICLWYPFYTGIGITIPLFVDGTLSDFTITFGAIVCVIFLIQSLFLLFKVFKLKTA